MQNTQNTQSKPKAPLSAERLEKLAQARVKALEKKRQLRDEREQEREAQAKEEILSQQEKPNENEESDVPDEPVHVRASKPKSLPVSLSLTDDDVHVIKEFVVASKAQKKEAKWKARKQELISELFARLQPEEETEEYYEPKPSAGNLSLFDDIY